LGCHDVAQVFDCRSELPEVFAVVELGEVGDLLETQQFVPLLCL
jgi:hypothetical protein